MEYVKLTPENLGREHICCAISNEKDVQVSSKKAWLAGRLQDGLVFLKAAERGKCFIEYLPAENAWLPLEAKGYMHINCFWVSGSFKGHGYANDLLSACIADAKAQGKKGLTVVTSDKKAPFLSDPKFLVYKGFKIADAAEPIFKLAYLPFTEDATPPSFKESARIPHCAQKGFVLFHTHACPFTAKYVPIVAETAHKMGIPFETVLLDTKEAAQNAPVVWTNYALFYDGKYVTNEILSDKKFIELASTLIPR